MFFTAMTIFGCSVLSVNSLECVSMNNQKCKIRPEMINVNSNELSFYPYSIKINIVAVVIVLMIHVQNYVFLMLSKTQISKYLI